jgi:hypothetical protein
MSSEDAIGPTPAPSVATATSTASPPEAAAATATTGSGSGIHMNTAQLKVYSNLIMYVVARLLGKKDEIYQNAMQLSKI